MSIRHIPDKKASGRALAPSITCRHSLTAHHLQALPDCGLEHGLIQGHRQASHEVGRAEGRRVCHGLLQQQRASVWWCARLLQGCCGVVLVQGGCQVGYVCCSLLGGRWLGCACYAWNRGGMLRSTRMAHLACACRVVRGVRATAPDGGDACGRGSRSCRCAHQPVGAPEHTAHSFSCQLECIVGFAHVKKGALVSP